MRNSIQSLTPYQKQSVATLLTSPHAGGGRGRHRWESLELTCQPAQMSQQVPVSSVWENRGGWLWRNGTQGLSLAYAHMHRFMITYTHTHPLQIWRCSGIWALSITIKVQLHRIKIEGFLCLTSALDQKCQQRFSQKPVPPSSWLPRIPVITAVYFIMINYAIRHPPL